MTIKTISSDSPDFLAYRKRVQNRKHLSRVMPMSGYRQQLDDLLDKPPHLRGITLPWSKTENNIRLRDGELSLWAGKNSHGKSTLLAHVMTWMAAKGQPVMIASFEMGVEQTIEKMLKQATGLENPTPQIRDKFFEKFGESIYFYDYQGTVDGDLVMDLCEFSAEVLGCKHIQIDSLTKVKHMVSDRNDLQADFVNNLHSSAKHFKTHIHLVAHEKKGSEESERHTSSRYAIKGSGAIPDQVDNVFIVWMDKDAKQNGKEDERKPDVLVRCDKQRHGTWEGYFSLYFPKRLNYQFVSSPDTVSMPCPGMNLRYPE